MILTPSQTLIIIIMVTIGTLLTRFIPFILLRGDRANNPYINYLGQVLPCAAIGLLIVYSLKDVSLKSVPYGIPEAIAISFIAFIHYWMENTLLSIGLGTVLYMVLVQFIFI